MVIIFLMIVIMVMIVIVLMRVIMIMAIMLGCGFGNHEGSGQFASFDIEDSSRIQLRTLCPVNACQRVDLANTGFQAVEFVWSYQVGFVEKYEIGGRDLCLRFRSVVQFFLQMLCINDGDDSVQAKAFG